MQQQELSKSYPSFVASSCSSCPTIQTEASQNYPIYVGLYDYSARNIEHLSFMKGDLIYIINNEEGDWWYARKKDGEEGYIPSYYVTEYTSAKE